MSELHALSALAGALGVSTSFEDGLGRPVAPPPETLVSVCAALGAPVARAADAGEGLRWAASARAARRVPPVLVAWDGVLAPVPTGGTEPSHAVLHFEGGGSAAMRLAGGAAHAPRPLPFGYHGLTIAWGGHEERGTVIAAPLRAWRRPGSRLAWGVGAHLAALRSRRSRSVGDLGDLERLCRWVAARGGQVVTVLPLLPTFNREPAEPSPYSPVSRLFWSELILDLGHAHVPVPAPPTLDVTAADAEVRRALAHLPPPDPASLDAELQRYARFRGTQARLGSDWRSWPAEARAGRIDPAHVDADEERFHLVAQTRVREQLDRLSAHLRDEGLCLGLDLAVGVHPDGYDPWSRPSLFADGMSVGAPPDRGFPSGQDWGFSPVLPGASREEGHRYLAASIRHQAAQAGVLRVDHVMALARLYWIPHGVGLDQGTYVAYPAEELFAVLTLESHRNRCEVVGENLGTVPPEIGAALTRHGIPGMVLAQFEAGSPTPRPPSGADVALIGTHDTPTLAGWVAGVDIGERIRCGLLDEAAGPAEREERAGAAARLAAAVGGAAEDLPDLLDLLLDWLGRAPSPLVLPWLEDLWLEAAQVNLPGTRSSQRPNWQRPMARLLDDALEDPEVLRRVRLLAEARSQAARPEAAPSA